MSTTTVPPRTAKVPHGVQLLHDPLLNKGTAFSEDERDALGLRGLLPPYVSSQDEQVARILENLRNLKDPLEKYVLLSALHDRNETLFFRVLVDYPDEMMPIVYTPTVGLACENYGHIYRQPRGLFISAKDRGRVAQILRNWPFRDVSIIVVTDGERILGLGDLGANGMGIPVGKLSLYTACAGIPPERCLPVMLDVGTNNTRLIQDPLYIGTRRRRLTGPEYDELVDEFVQAANEVFPGVLVQFEDFGNHNAFRVLHKYRGEICTFNDDIQGTAAVVLAGISSAMRLTGRKIQNEKFLFMGAGEAATGVADLLVSAMVAKGQVAHEALRRNWLFDSRGLVVKSRGDLAPQKLRYAHEHAECKSFLEAIRQLHPTAIIGLAAVGGTFTPEVLREMASLNARPIVFALSNPTSKSECTAREAYEHTGGRALFACGSPFDPVTYEGHTFVPRQGNNSYIFPGVGLGVMASGAKRVTDEMFLAAAEALTACVTEADLQQGSLYPPLAAIRDVSARLAAAVASVAYRQGIATVAEPADLLPYIRSLMYVPRYASYVGR
ncbi:MAG TPA: NAD-dependent malic enzyme [Usitatibacter sp.]|nr:NAD-dependent malic enzyme [Usitatibacter sp.]